MVTDGSGVCKKYLITGGDGFIGVNLSKFLISRGDYVQIIDNNITSNPVFLHNRLSRTICEVENFSVDQLPWSPDCIFPSRLSCGSYLVYGKTEISYFT